MVRRRRKTKTGKWVGRALSAILAVPALYLLAALAGALVPVNRDWREPNHGITVYIAENGVHTDILMPVRAAGLDWRSLLPPSDARAPPPGAQWVAFGVGERAVYLDTPRWRDLRAKVALRALTRGQRVVHVEWVVDPGYAAREIRLRPEEYRRLWAAVRASFRDSRPRKIANKGYGTADVFYEGVGHANAFATCNQWTAATLRLAGIEASLWSPFVEGLVWRYRKTDPPRPL